MASIVSTNPAVRAVIEGKAPRPAQLAAARGVLPLPPNDQLEVLVSFANGPDEELSGHAKKTLLSQDIATLEAALRSNEIAPGVLSHFAGREELPRSVHEAIITNANTPHESLVTIAKNSTSGDVLELISFNQQLLLQVPGLIDGILGNANRSAEADRRVSEIKREFFEKERGAAQVASELRAQGKDAAAEFIESSDFGAASDITAEDAAFLAEHIVVPDADTDDSWLALEYLEELYEETDVDRKAAYNKILGELSEDGEIASERVSMLNKIMRLNVKDRVKMAMKGDREARNILMRDPNRIVAQAVIQNPKITEQEVETISAMRSVPEDVLRQIAINRQWSRNYKISLNLAKNPRTPIAQAMPILNRMQNKDLAQLSNDKNVSEAIRRHAFRLTLARKGK